MPNDLFSSGDDDDDDKDASKSGPDARFSDFDCPSCNANNPCGESFGNDDEVLCNYCGAELRAIVNDSGRLRFREL